MSHETYIHHQREHEVHTGDDGLRNQMRYAFARGWESRSATMIFYV
jgi:hypothetical protein